jgi:hypothetical protein
MLKELTENEVNIVSGGLDPDSGGLAIIALGFAGGPFTIGFGLAVGGGLLLRSMFR